MPEETGQQAGQIISQTDYTPSDFSNASWEVLGELVDNTEFQPMEIKALNGGEVPVDPMFRDYGGVPRERSEKRWHLPAHLAVRNEAEQGAENTDPKTIPQSLTEYDLDNIRAEAYARGREEALAESAATQLERVARIEDSIATLVKDLSNQVKAESLQAEANAVQLAVEISSKIINSAVEINPEYIVELVHEALTLSGGAKVRKIRVSPQDFEYLEYAGIRKKLTQVEGDWDFEADATIRAGCILESSSGEVNFELDKAWERVRDNVVKVLR